MRFDPLRACVAVHGQPRDVICHKDVFSLAEYLHPFVLLLFFSRSLYKLVVTAVTPPRPIISTPRYEHIKEGVGVNIIPYPVPSGNLVVQIARGNWIGDYVDPNTFLDMFVTGGGNNRTGWSNRRYDQLIEAAAEEKKEDKRMEIFREAENILVADDVPRLTVNGHARP